MSAFGCASTDPSSLQELRRDMVRRLHTQPKTLMEVAKIPACARWWANAIYGVDFGGGRSLGCKVERKVRTPKGRIPCENG
ncbi:MAG: hypothetical protein ACPGGN_06915, partial [Opitutales bacterium]